MLMPLLFQDGRWFVSLTGPTPKNTIEATAYKAIRRRLEAYTHVDFPHDGDYPVKIRLRTASGDERRKDSPPLSPTGYRLTADAETITLLGGSPKGTLNAVYDFLERLGLRWPVADSNGGFAAPPARLEIEESDVTVEPSFPRITFFQDLRTLRNYDSDPSLGVIQQQNDRDLINWMGRHRFTGLFGNLPSSPEPWGEAARRGITRQYGGHILPRLLPRDLFHDHPEYFPMNEEGERFPGNVCSSQPEALRVVSENARHFAKETRADVLHLWGEDVLGGKWCCCPECRACSVQDQYLRVVNAVADSLAEEFPQLRVAFIAYHDTLTPRLTLAPRPNVVLLFAPRNRCYRHALADASCSRNAEILSGLEEYARIFGPGRLHTFEYYGDALLWCSAAVTLPRMIVEDLKTYRDLGVVDAGCLMFGGYSWFSHPLNLYAFARASREDGLSAERIVEEFAEAQFPGAREPIRRYYDELEAASRLLAERTDWFYRVPSSPDAAAALLPDAERAASAWEALTATLNAAMVSARPQAGETLVRTRQSLRFSQHLVRAYRDRILAASLADAEARKKECVESAAGEIRAALRILHDLSPYKKGSWGAEGHGESLRLRRLLNDLAPESDVASSV
jgi:hypothetical protein